MAKLDITKPEIMLYLTEAYEKEKRLRSFWNSKNTEKIQLAATLTNEPTNFYEQDVIKNTMIEGMATITRDMLFLFATGGKYQSATQNPYQALRTYNMRIHSSTLEWETPKRTLRLARPDTDLSPYPLMRPVDPETKRILYEPKPEFCRLQYLNKRYKIIPGKRYYFPECNTWDHGWRICDSKIRQGRQYGETGSCKSPSGVMLGWHATQIITSKPLPSKNVDLIKVIHETAPSLPN